MNLSYILSSLFGVFFFSPQMGLGPCAKEAFEDPIGHVEHALSVAWNSTADIIEAIGSTIAKDFNHVSERRPE